MKALLKKLYDAARDKLRPRTKAIIAGTVTLVAAKAAAYGVDLSAAQEDVLTGILTVIAVRLGLAEDRGAA